MNRVGEPLPQTVLQLVDGWVLPIGERRAIEQVTLQDRVTQYLSDCAEWVPLAVVKKDIQGRDGEIVDALAKLTEVGLIELRKKGNSKLYRVLCPCAPLGTGTGTGRESLFKQSISKEAA